MQLSHTNRYYRRRPASREAASFKKDNQPEQQFFGETTHEPFFKPVASLTEAVTVQRKCDDCDKEDKVQRAPEKKEEEKKVMKKEDKMEEEKVMKKEEKKEKEKVQRAPEKKEEEKVMKKEDKKEEGKVMKKEEKKEEEKVRKKEATATAVNTSATASGYINSINGKGQNMNPGLQHFYESKIGADFSDVKIHTGKDAADSAKDINAQAYAYGNNIVFNEGKYQPETSEGKHLLAHELAHVVQVENGESKVKRKIKYKNPTYTETDAVETVLANKDFALTTPTINGVELPNSISGAGEIIFKEFDKGASMKKIGKNNTCTYNEPEIEVSANIAIIKTPANKKWTGQANGANYEHLNKKCKGVGNIPVEMTGEPDADTVHKKIKKNELEHFTDLKSLSAAHLEQLMTLLKSFNDTSVTTDADCLKNFLAFVGNKDAVAIKAFLEALIAKVTARDVKPGPHHFLPEVRIAANCDKINIKVKPSV